MRIQYSTISKKGYRAKNEDAFKVVECWEEHRWMGVVCDGMGGHSVGEVAAETVAESIAAYWQTHGNEPDSQRKVIGACEVASKALDEQADSLGHIEMGTTLVMASIEDGLVTIAHVGDSRCYLQRASGEMIYQTKDHIKLSFGWEVVARCFFSYRPEIVQPDVKQFKLNVGDRLLLCSDGIYKSMAPEILQTNMMDEKETEEILDRFDSLCNKKGGDNYTAILVRILP